MINPLDLSNLSPRKRSDFAMENEIVLIADSRVRGIQIQDNGEPFVDLTQAQPALAFDRDRTGVHSDAKSIFHGRAIIGEMLAAAQSRLPEDLRLLIKECHRPLSVQNRFWDGYIGFLKRTHPEWNQARLESEASKYVAPLDVAPHATGGAVDLTLITRWGRQLEMGTAFNASPGSTQYATYTHATNISPEAKRNREILIEAMTAAGFTNYPTEWWHWSYGDKYWAFANQKSHALFGPVEIESKS